MGAVRAIYARGLPQIGNGCGLLRPCIMCAARVRVSRSRPACVCAGTIKAGAAAGLFLLPEIFPRVCAVRWAPVILAKPHGPGGRGG